MARLRFDSVYLVAPGHNPIGPFDLDGDGKLEVLLTDYSGGQRVHVFEVQGTNQWELVYSTAVPAENPERAAVRDRGGRELHRADLLAEITATSSAMGRTT